MSYRVTFTVDLSVRSAALATDLARSICERIEESWFVASDATVEDVAEVES